MVTPWSCPFLYQPYPAYPALIFVGRQTRTKVALYLLTITQQVLAPSFPGPRTVQRQRQ